MLIKVTQKCIDNGRYYCSLAPEDRCSLCPVSLAMKEAGLVAPEAGSFYGRFMIEDRMIGFKWPDEVHEWIEAFDSNDGKMEPFEFEWDIESYEN